MIYIPQSIATPELIEAAKRLSPGEEVEIWPVQITFPAGFTPPPVVVNGETLATWVSSQDDEP